MQRIDATQTNGFATLPRVRWIGPDGGWRKGIVVSSQPAVAVDLHRGESLVLFDGQYEDDGPRNDKGERV